MSRCPASDPLGRKMVYDLVMDLKGMGKTVFFSVPTSSATWSDCVVGFIGLMVRGRLARVYDRKDFFLNSDDLIHLVVVPLSEDQRREIEPLLSGIYQLPGKTGSILLRPPVSLG